MSSAGSGLTTQSPTKESPSSSKNSVTLFQLFNSFIGLPADIVPATFKKKKAVATAPRIKGEDEEKPGRPEETARPTGLGRGQR